MPSETKSITHSHLDSALLSFVKGEVELLVDVLIRVSKVNSRRHYLVFYSEHRSDSLDSPSGSEQVSSHVLGGVEIDLISMFAESLSYGLSFGYISLRSRSTMEVDRIDLFERDLSIGKAVKHYGLGAHSFRMWGSEVISVGRETSSGEFTIYLGATSLGMFVFF